MKNENFFMKVNNIAAAIDCNIESQESIDDIYTNLTIALLNEINLITPSSRKTKQKSGKQFWNELLERLWQDMR